MPSFVRIHTTPAGKGSTWLQLFFDLVYVAILIEIGNQFAHDLTWRGLIQFIILFVPIWWSWLEFVEYGSRYPVDDIGMRILTVVYMGVMLLLAFEIHRLDNGNNMTVFILTYALSKFILSAMYRRAWLYYPDYRELTHRQSFVFGLVGLSWIALAIIAPSVLWYWVIPIVIGTLSPLFIRLVHKARRLPRLVAPPIKYHFLADRFGELTIIVLGEFFIKLVISASERTLAPINYAIGIGLLAISVSLWWLYFDHLEHINLSKLHPHIAIWSYSHFPLLMAITAYGVVGNKIFEAVPLEPLPDAKRLLFTLALATAVLAYGAIEWASREKEEELSRKPQPWVRLVAAATLLAMGIWGHWINVGWLVLFVASIVVAQVVFDVYTRIQYQEAATV